MKFVLIFFPKQKTRCEFEDFSPRWTYIVQSSRCRNLLFLKVIQNIMSRSLSKVSLWSQMMKSLWTVDPLQVSNFCESQSSCFVRFKYYSPCIYFCFSCFCNIIVACSAMTKFKTKHCLTQISFFFSFWKIFVR